MDNVNIAMESQSQVHQCSLYSGHTDAGDNELSTSQQSSSLASSAPAGCVCGDGNATTHCNPGITGHCQSDSSVCMPSCVPCFSAIPMTFSDKDLESLTSTSCEQWLSELS